MQRATEDDELSRVVVSTNRWCSNRKIAVMVLAVVLPVAILIVDFKLLPVLACPQCSPTVQKAMSLPNELGNNLRKVDSRSSPSLKTNHDHCVSLDRRGATSSSQSLDELLSKSKQVFVTMPAKAAGTSMR